MTTVAILRTLAGAIAFTASLALAGQDGDVSPTPHDLPEFGVIDPMAWVTEGSVVPGLELPLIDGSGTFDLASLRGKKVLLIQFASW